MRVITKIARQKNNPERYNIYLNEEYAFPVDEAVLIQFSLTKGKVLEDWLIEEIAFEDEVRKAYNRGIHFLSFQMRSEYEVKKKLLDAEYTESAVLEAIQKLKKLGFLDDESYSKALLETKKKTMKKGPIAIRQDLKKKGIDKELQDGVIESYSEREQIEIALKLAEKIIRSEQKKTPAQIKQKIQETLTRKGYPYSVTDQVLTQITIERAEDDWAVLMESQGEKVWGKYARKFEGYELHMRFKQALYQKGFPIEVIERFIEEKEQE